MTKFQEKFTDAYWAILKKFPSDKITHFCVFGLFVAIFMPLGWIATILAFILMLTLTILKEKYVDGHFDIKDVTASWLGGVFVLVIKLIYTLIFCLFK